MGPFDYIVEQIDGDCARLRRLDYCLMNEIDISGQR